MFRSFVSVKLMKLLKLWRTFKEGLKNFLRNGWLSFATVSVLSISLYIASITVLVAVGASSAIKNIQEKINVSIYFNPEVAETRILEIKNKLSGYREVKSAEYVSKNKALDEFLATSGDDPSIKEALEEIGGNPLLASLVIKAQNPEQYEIISTAISQSNFSGEISRINYEKNKTVIEKLSGFIRTVEKTGLVLSLIFILVSVLITFNTIRITIYSHKQEFEVMRLVGASNTYVRMPHIFEGIFYGTASAIITLIFLFFTFQFAAPALQKIISREALVSFYFHNLALMAIIIIFAGAMFGVVSSFIAVRRYLKV